MKIISNQLSPNFQLKDALHAVAQICRRKEVEKEYFEQKFSSENYILLNAARSGLGLIADNLKETKETRKIGIPAFCCAVMATPFLTKGFEIEWIDTDDQGIILMEDFKKKAKNIGCVIVPHTFGIKAPLAEIIKIAKENKIWVIEDCAHTFKSSSPGSDFQLHSFGREKDVSCVSGGALVWNKKISSLVKGRLEEINLKNSSKKWTIRHLLQPLIYSLAIPWWHIGGKIIPAFFSKIRFLPKAVTFSEKFGKEDFPKERMGTPFQWVLKRQINNLNTNIEHRRIIAEAWKKVLSKKFLEAKIIIPDNYFRVIIAGINRKEILKQSQVIGFHFTEWDGHPIAPAGVDLKAFGYTPGQCPNAEKFTKNYLTFPTNKRVSLKDVQYFDRMFRA